MTILEIQNFYTELLHAHLSSDNEKIFSLVSSVDKSEYKYMLRQLLRERRLSVLRILIMNDIDPTIGDDKSFLADLLRPGFDIMDKYFAKCVRKWLRDYDTQMMLITKHPNSFKILYDNKYIHKKLKNQYKFLINATSLNLL